MFGLFSNRRSIEDQALNFYKSSYHELVARGVESGYALELAEHAALSFAVLAYELRSPNFSAIRQREENKND